MGDSSSGKRGFLHAQMGFLKRFFRKEARVSKGPATEKMPQDLAASSMVASTESPRTETASASAHGATADESVNGSDHKQATPSPRMLLDPVSVQVVTEVVAKPRHRISIEVDPAFLRQLSNIVFAIFFIYCALLTLPFGYRVSGSGVDASWQFGLNYLVNAGFHFGSEIVFTYGPLGFITCPLNFQNNLATANLIRGAVWLILLIHLIRIHRTAVNGFLKALVLMAGLCLSRYLLLGWFDYFIVAAVLVVALDLIEQPRQWIGYLWLIALCALAMFVKFTGYVLCIVAVGVYVLVSIDWPPRPSAWRACAAAVAAIAVGPLAFLIYNPSPGGLSKYLTGSLELSSGFNEAMSLPTSPQDAFYGVVLAGLFLLGLGYAVAKKVLVWTAAPVFALLYWVAFKHGFVRSDGHVIITYFFAVFLGAYLICLLRPCREIVIKYTLVLPVLVLAALSGINTYVPVWNSDFWSSSSNRQLGLDLLDWPKTAGRTEEAKRKPSADNELPMSFSTLLRGSTAVVFPWELTYAQSGQFRLWPLYNLQTYSSYSRYLDTMTASELKAASKHIDYVLFEWKASDGRHPLLDVPATWCELLDEYEPVLGQPGKMILAHRKAPPRHKLIPSLGSVPFQMGRWLDLPRRPAVVWAKMSIPYSKEGYWRKIFYKADAMYLSLERASGGVGRYRIVPGVLSSVFPLNIMPLDFDALQTLWGTSRVYDPIVRLRLESDSPNDYGRLELQLFEDQVSDIKVVEDKSPSFQSKFGLDSPDKITNSMLFDIDLVDKGSVPAWPDEKHPWVLPRDHRIELSGWSVTADKSSSFDSLYAVINGRGLVRAVGLPRADVATVFKNTALEGCGYELTIPTTGLAIGPQRLDIVGVVNQTHQVYRANPMYIEVR
jgi:hypothetical protein